MYKLRYFYGFNNSKKKKIYQVDKNDPPLVLMWKGRFISAFKGLCESISVAWKCHIFP